MAVTSNNPPLPDMIRNYKNMKEYGSIGQKKSYGIFMEDFLYELQGQRGIEAYKEMLDNDDIIGSIMFAIEMLIRQVTWNVDPQGVSKTDKAAAQFIQGCLDDMDDTWQDTLSEILSFLPFGWSFHEICYKRRMGRNKNRDINSKYNDGLIGWKKLPIRSQDTLWRWEYDENDELVGMSQMPPPNFQVLTIPASKALHFRTKSRKNNPEGRSILRNAYRLYYFKRRFQEIEGIGIERDLAGLPMIQPPEGVDIWNSDDEDMVRAFCYAEDLVKNIRRDEKEGIVLPNGWTFSLVNGGSRRQFEIGNVIERIDNRIAMTCMADFVLLGHQQTGSFALSSDKTELFGVAMGTYLDIICEVFNNQAIPRLIDINGEHFRDITNYPKLNHSDIEKPNILEFASYLEKMVGMGVIVPDENLERYVRDVGSLPQAVENAEFPPDHTKQNESLEGVV